MLRARYGFNLLPQQGSEFIAEAEIGVDARVWGHGCELDEQVQVTLARPEVVAQRGAKCVQSAHAVVGAQLRYCLAVRVEQTGHIHIVVELSGSYGNPS